MRWKWTEKPCGSLKSQLKWLKLQVEFSSRSLASSKILELFFFDTPKQPQSFDVCFFRNLGKILTTPTSGGDGLLFVWNFCSKEFHSRGPEKFCCVSFNTKDFHNNRFDRDYVEFNVRISEAQISMGCQGLRPRVGRISGVPGTWKKLWEWQSFFLNHGFEPNFRNYWKNAGSWAEAPLHLRIWRAICGSLSINLSRLENCFINPCPQQN